MVGMKQLLWMITVTAIALWEFGTTGWAEGDADHSLFLRYAGSAVVEAEWKPTRSKVIYKGPPATHEERYRVIPCVTRMLDGTIVALVEPGGNKPIFIRSTDEAKTWSKPYRGILADGVRTISTIGMQRDGHLMAVSEKPLRLAHSRDHGKTWSKGRLIATGPLANAWVWTGGRPVDLGKRQAGHSGSRVPSVGLVERGCGSQQ